MNLVPPSLPDVAVKAKALSVPHAELSQLLDKREELRARAVSLTAEVAALESTASVEDTEQFRTLLEKRLQLEFITRDAALATGAIPSALAQLKLAHMALVRAGKAICDELEEVMRCESRAVIEKALAPFSEQLDAATRAGNQFSSQIRDRDYITPEPAQMVQNSGRLLEAWGAFTGPGPHTSAAETSAVPNR